MKQRTVHIYVFDSISDWEYGYAAAGINNPQFQKNPGRFRIGTVALKKTPVESMGGIRIQPDLTLDQVSPDDSAMLILPGGTSWDQGRETEAVEVARTFLDSGVPVAAICGATAGLARGGLLDHRKHTSNAPDYLAATGYGGASLYQDAPAFTDDNVITASGMAPVDFARHIFKCLDLFKPEVLDAWYGLFKTGRAEYFYALMQAMGA
jgi:putative intracellular protease/amidase